MALDGQESPQFGWLTAPSLLLTGLAFPCLSVFIFPHAFVSKIEFYQYSESQAKERGLTLAPDT